MDNNYVMKFNCSVNPCFNPMCLKNNNLNTFSRKGHSEAIFKQKWFCLPPWRVTERALSDAGERQASTQPPDRTSLICLWSGGGRSDKGQGFGCDKEGPYVLLWPWLSPRLSVTRGHPGARSWPTTRKASKTVFSHTGMNLTLCCQIYRKMVCVYMW